MSTVDPGEALQLTCKGCGKRLKTAGAKPGRTGRCASCGTVFQVPNPPPSSKPKSANSAATSAPQRPARTAPIPLGFGPGPRELGATATANPKRAARPERPTAPIDPVARGGVFRAPNRLESSWLESLRYPFWDAAGITWLLVLPTLLALTTLTSVHLVGMVLEGGNMAVFGPFAFPMLLVHAGMLTYAGMVLGEVVSSTIQGEVVHPRWPDPLPGSLATGFARWMAALLPGVGPTIALAWALGRDRDLSSASVQVALWGIAAFGFFYSLMAYVALLLHGDVRAASPTVVLPAIWQAGRGYVHAATLAVLAVMLGRCGAIAAEQVQNPLLYFGAIWLMWLTALYLALVAARTLGVAYLKAAKNIGWFREKQQWGVR